MIEMFLFVAIHERVGFCLGMATGLILAGGSLWIAKLVGAE